MERANKFEATDLKLKRIIVKYIEVLVEIAACSSRKQAALAEPLSEPASAAATFGTFGTFGFPSMEPMEPGARRSHQFSPSPLVLNGLTCFRVFPRLSCLCSSRFNEVVQVLHVQAGNLSPRRTLSHRHFAGPGFLSQFFGSSHWLQVRCSPLCPTGPTTCKWLIVQIFVSIKHIIHRYMQSMFALHIFKIYFYIFSDELHRNIMMPFLNKTCRSCQEEDVCFSLAGVKTLQCL